MMRSGRFAAAALQARDHVGPIRLERDDLDRDAFRFEHLLQVVGRRLFAARRIAGVEPAASAWKCRSVSSSTLFQSGEGEACPNPTAAHSTALNKVSRIGRGWYPRARTGKRRTSPGKMGYPVPPAFQRRLMRVRQIQALGVCILACVTGLLAQQPAAQDPQTFRSRVTVVPVDVRVVDRIGKPITGLKAEDFTIAEDGVPQKIVHFSFQTLTPTPGGRRRRAAPPPPAARRNARAAEQAHLPAGARDRPPGRARQGR